MRRQVAHRDAVLAGQLFGCGQTLLHGGLPCVIQFEGVGVAGQLAACLADADRRFIQQRQHGLQRRVHRCRPAACSAARARRARRRLRGVCHRLRCSSSAGGLCALDEPAAVGRGEPTPAASSAASPGLQVRDAVSSLLTWKRSSSRRASRSRRRDSISSTLVQQSQPFAVRPWPLPSPAAPACRSDPAARAASRAHQRLEFMLPVDIQQVADDFPQLLHGHGLDRSGRRVSGRRC